MIAYTIYDKHALSKTIKTETKSDEYSALCHTLWVAWDAWNRGHFSCSKISVTWVRCLWWNSSVRDHADAGTIAHGFEKRPTIGKKTMTKFQIWHEDYDCNWNRNQNSCRTDPLEPAAFHGPQGSNCCEVEPLGTRTLRTRTRTAFWNHLFKFHQMSPSGHRLFKCHLMVFGYFIHTLHHDSGSRMRQHKSSPAATCRRVETMIRKTEQLFILSV